jgi:hypothetical protein
MLVAMAIDRNRAEELLGAGESGILEWNELRRVGEAIPALDGITLSGADLRGANLQGANLSDANMACSDLSGANLTNAVLRNAVLRGAKVFGANFSGAVLSGIDLREAEFVLAPGSVQPFEQLKLFYDYTKWHVQLYAGGTLASLALTELGRGWLVLIPLVFFLLAAACAGTLLGNVSRFTSELELNGTRMSALFWKELLRGRCVRILEKVFFWAGVGSLIWVVLCRPAGTPPTQLCLIIPSMQEGNQPAAAASASGNATSGIANLFCLDSTDKQDTRALASDLKDLSAKVLSTKDTEHKLGELQKVLEKTNGKVDRLVQVIEDQKAVLSKMESRSTPKNKRGTNPQTH